jgi:hypothetical protein
MSNICPVISGLLYIFLAFSIKNPYVKSTHFRPSVRNPASPTTGVLIRP